MCTLRREPDIPGGRFNRNPEYDEAAYPSNDARRAKVPSVFFARFARHEEVFAWLNRVKENHRFWFYNVKGPFVVFAQSLLPMRYWVKICTGSIICLRAISQRLDIAQPNVAQIVT